MTDPEKRCGSPVTYIYFITFIFLCSFIMLNIVVAVSLTALIISLETLPFLAPITCPSLSQLGVNMIQAASK